MGYKLLYFLVIMGTLIAWFGIMIIFLLAKRKFLERKLNKEENEKLAAMWQDLEKGY